jgi:hypothetical protein
LVVVEDKGYILDLEVGNGAVVDFKQNASLLFVAYSPCWAASQTCVVKVEEPGFAESAVSDTVSQTDHAIGHCAHTFGHRIQSIGVIDQKTGSVVPTVLLVTGEQGTALSAADGLRRNVQKIAGVAGCA